MAAEFDPVAGAAGLRGRARRRSSALAAVDEGVALLEEAGIDRVRAKGMALTAMACDLVDEWLAPLGFEVASPRDPTPTRQPPHRAAPRRRRYRRRADRRRRGGARHPAARPHPPRRRAAVVPLHRGVGRPRPHARPGRRTDSEGRAAPGARRAGCRMPKAGRIPEAGVRSHGRPRGEGRGRHGRGVGHRAGHGEPLRRGRHEGGAGRRREGRARRRGRRAQRPGVEAVGVPTDVSDGAAVEALRDAALERFGGIHVACNNAGVATGGRIWEQTVDDWKWVLGVNLWGVIHGVRTFVPVMLRQGEGHVVNTASMAGLTSPPFMGIYNVTQARGRHAVRDAARGAGHGDRRHRRVGAVPRLGEDPHRGGGPQPARPGDARRRNRGGRPGGVPRGPERLPGQRPRADRRGRAGVRRRSATGASTC